MAAGIRWGIGIIIPADVACTCPARGLVSSPPGASIVFREGAWRLEGLDLPEDEARGAEVAWAKTACAHGLRRVEVWPLLGDLLLLRSLLQHWNDPDCAALDALVSGFLRQPGEVGPLGTATVAADERHRRALEGMDARLATFPAPCLLDSDTDQVIASTTTVVLRGGVATPQGGVLVNNPSPGPPYSYYLQFDAGGLRVERDGERVFGAVRVAQEVGEHGTRLVNLDTAASVEIDGKISYRPRGVAPDVPCVYPERIHVEMRTLTADFIAEARADLDAVVSAALESDHPIRFPDRFG